VRAPSGALPWFAVAVGLVAAAVAGGTRRRRSRS
jgi:hypothetical protein